MITEFRGKNKWLSNFAIVNVELDGVVYPSVEHAYASAKSTDPLWKTICSDTSNTPACIKRKGRKVQLISNWDGIKESLMFGLLEQKFKLEPYRSLLLDTGEKHIQEGNYWNDTYWGIKIKTGKGQNILGKMIMAIREELNNYKYNR